MNGWDPTGESLISVSLGAGIIGGLAGSVAGAVYGAARASQDGLEGASFWKAVGLYAAGGGLAGGAIGGALGYGTTSLAYYLWSSSAGVSATAAYAQAGFYFGFPAASAAFGLGIVQYKNGIENDDPVDTVFGAIGIATSLFGIFGSFRSVAAGSGGSPTVRRFLSADELNEAANNPKPNTQYEYGTYSWATDNHGRVTVAKGRVVLGDGGRNLSLQGQIGNAGAETDVGFHLIADSFRGPTNRVNVVPGNGRPIGDGLPNLNQGAFKRFENTIRRLVRSGDKVEIEVTAGYNGGNKTARPDYFVAGYRVNGGPLVSQRLPNKR